MTSTLFDWARTRTADPATSRAAAKTVRVHVHVERICAVLEQQGVALSCERIAGLCELGTTAVARRMKDMERAGLIQRDGTGRNRAGRAVTLWRRS